VAADDTGGAVKVLQIGEAPLGASLATDRGGKTTPLPDFTPTHKSLIMLISVCKLRIVEFLVSNNQSIKIGG
jgi:hypothetical protein